MRLVAIVCAFAFFSSISHAQTSERSDIDIDEEEAAEIDLCEGELRNGNENELSVECTACVASSETDCSTSSWVTYRGCSCPDSCACFSYLTTVGIAALIVLPVVASASLACCVCCLWIWTSSRMRHYTAARAFKSDASEGEVKMSPVKHRLGSSSQYGSVSLTDSSLPEFGLSLDSRRTFRSAALEKKWQQSLSI